MIKKTLTAFIAAATLFGFNTNSFAFGFFDAWFGPTSSISAWLDEADPIFSSTPKIIVDEADPVGLNPHRRKNQLISGIHCR